ncbi:MAG: type III-B CRISPR module RAMP protein Cmr4 [Nitrospirota bacterium]
MSIDGCLYTFYTLTPLHAGAGDSAGAIDLPVQREKHTEYPCVYSSGIKGSLRCFFEQNDALSAQVPSIFGNEGDAQRDSTSGKVIFTDAKILLFPVRSSEGVFKWATCPFVIERLKRDLDFIGLPKNEITVSPDTAFKGYSVILEDFPVTVSDCSSSVGLFKFFTKLTGYHIPEDVLKDRIIIVSDDVFKTLVTTATQIIARNVLDDETKKSNNLWYEEVVPADAVFYTIMKPAFKGNAAIATLSLNINNCIMQIGGNETIGYGFVKMSSDLAPAFRHAASEVANG